MYPNEVTYRLAQSPRDYKGAHKLLREIGGDDYDPDKPLTWPTVVADREGSIVGVLSTWKISNGLLAGPLAGRSPIIIMRLSEAYDKVMTQAGVKTYWAPCRKSNTKMFNIMKKLGMEPEMEDSTAYWFRRKLA